MQPLQKFFIVVWLLALFWFKDRSVSTYLCKIHFWNAIKLLEKWKGFFIGKKYNFWKKTSLRFLFTKNMLRRLCLKQNPNPLYSMTYPIEVWNSTKVYHKSYTKMIHISAYSNVTWIMVRLDSTEDSSVGVATILKLGIGESAPEPKFVL